MKHYNGGERAEEGAERERNPKVSEKGEKAIESLKRAG